MGLFTAYFLSNELFSSAPFWSRHRYICERIFFLTKVFLDYALLSVGSKKIRSCFTNNFPSRMGKIQLWSHLKVKVDFQKHSIQYLSFAVWCETNKFLFVMLDIFDFWKRKSHFWLAQWAEKRHYILRFINELLKFSYLFGSITRMKNPIFTIHS